MRNAQKPDHRNLSTIINWLKEGRFVIPDFQREFEWKPADIRDLMRSIFLDYYIGSLLLWEGNKENFESLACQPVYGCDNEDSKDYIVLDGQQRLTAMYYAFIAPDIPLPNRSNRYFYFIKVDRFMAEEYDESFYYEWTSRGEKLLDNPEEQYEQHIFPLSIIGAGGWDLPNWVQGYQEYWKNRTSDSSENIQANLHAKNAQEFGKHLKSITDEYLISYIELDKNLSVDKVCDIFTQINSKGIRLDVFDLINALLKPKGLQLRYMWREVQDSLSFPDSDKMNVYVLQVMSILRQNYCSPKYLYFLLPGQEKAIKHKDGSKGKEVLIKDIEDFEKAWNEAVETLQSSLKLLKHPQEYGAVSSKYLPYVSILPVFSALRKHAKTLPTHSQLDAQRKIKHWYWASVFTNRYSGSVESTAARDFIDMKAWLENTTNEPALIHEFKVRFKNLELRKETRSGTSVYNGVFNLFVLQGARDWMTGDIPQHDDLDDHHIVPASWGKKNLKGDTIHTILNRTPLTVDTNRKAIHDDLPNVYLPELIKNNGESNVRSILESHFISKKAQEILLRKPFTADDYEAFIAERQKTIQDAIENLLIKERLDLAPQLRELDEEIEKTELSLREIVSKSLSNSELEMPPHTIQKIEERIQRASKKNAALDLEYLETLEGKLEYADLSDLKDILTSKQLWTLFEPFFNNKETLFTKFGQLAELRNTIRHSRSVDDITRKEGEAAILWFEKISAKTHNFDVAQSSVSIA